MSWHTCTFFVLSSQMAVLLVTKGLSASRPKNHALEAHHHGSEFALGRSYIVLFPFYAMHTDMSFSGLRAKGGFIISAAWDSGAQKLSGPVLIHSEVGGKCVLQLPRCGPGGEAALRHNGKDLLTARCDARLSFQTYAGADYVIIVRNRRHDQQMHI